MNYEPKQDRVLIKKVSKSNKTEGGLIIPETAVTKGAVKGEVIAKGPGLFLDGQMKAVNVEKGDLVMFDDNNAVELGGSAYGEKTVFIVREYEIICGVEE